MKGGSLFPPTIKIAGLHSENFMELVYDRYIVKYVSDDRQDMDRFLCFVGQDKTKKYLKDSKQWNVSKDALTAILENVSEDKLDIQGVIDDEDKTGFRSGYKLYDYQKDIVDFCLEKGNAIIAAACGAGKTPIMIATFLELRKNGRISKNAKGLVVVKSSLKFQWKMEIEKFSYLSASILDTYKGCVGSSIPNKITKLENEQKKLSGKANQSLDEFCRLQDEIEALTKEADKKFAEQFDPKSDLYIVNYETLRDDMVRKYLHKMNLEVVLADEVHLIKSDTSKRSKALYEFSDVKCKFGATATPIKKNPLDAYGISKFISPTTFKSRSSFSSRYLTFSGFGRVSGSQNEKELNEKLSDFMIVKTKDEVSSQLPEVVPITRYCKLSDAQERMSDQLFEEISQLKEEERQYMVKFSGNPPADDENLLKIQANIMARQTFASELADSEELLKASDSSLAKKYVTGSKSSKIELLLDLLDEILESGEKVVIFSKYKKLQDILTKEITAKFKDVKIAYVNGELSSEARYDEVYNKFRDNDDYKVLIMSDAGAEGISISWCKYLIEMEPADSYLIQTQRRGRIERADSIHDTVYVYQLVAENSFDEVGLKIIAKKEKYDDEIIKGNL